MTPADHSKTTSDSNVLPGTSEATAVVNFGGVDHPRYKSTTSFVLNYLGLIGAHAVIRTL